MARAEDPQTALDDAEIILEAVRGLASSKEGALPSGDSWSSMPWSQIHY